MKLVSQMGGYPNKPDTRASLLKRLRRAGRRVPWGHVAWCVFAIATFLIVLKAYSLLASSIKTVGGAQ